MGMKKLLSKQMNSTFAFLLLFLVYSGHCAILQPVCNSGSVTCASGDQFDNINSTVTISDCVFTDCPALRVLSAGSLTLNNVRFQDSLGGSGGAIYNDNGNLTLTNVIFNRTIANVEGGAFYSTNGYVAATNISCIGTTSNGGSGGCISIYGSNLECRNCQFSNSARSSSGAGIRAQASSQQNPVVTIYSGSCSSTIGSCLSFSNTNATISGFTVTNSEGTSGNIIAMRNSQVTATNLQSSGTSSTSFNGHIQVEGSTFVCNNCQFNNATSTSSGVFLETLVSYSSITLNSFSLTGSTLPGGIDIKVLSDVFISDSTFSNNSITVSGGIVVSSGYLRSIRNTFRGNRATINTYGISVSGSCVADIYENTFTNNSVNNVNARIGSIFVAGTANIYNTTITYNTCGVGCGIVSTGGIVNLFSGNTISYNRATFATAYHCQDDCLLRFSGSNIQILGNIGANVIFYDSPSLFSTLTKGYLNVTSAASNIQLDGPIMVVEPVYALQVNQKVQTGFATVPTVRSQPCQAVVLNTTVTATFNPGASNVTIPPVSLQLQDIFDQPRSSSDVNGASNTNMARTNSSIFTAAIQTFYPITNPIVTLSNLAARPVVGTYNVSIRLIQLQLYTGKSAPSFLLNIVDATAPQNSNSNTNSNTNSSTNTNSTSTNSTNTNSNTNTNSTISDNSTTNGNNTNGNGGNNANGNGGNNTNGNGGNNVSSGISASTDSGAPTDTTSAGGPVVQTDNTMFLGTREL
jgi:hypothetical protein